MDKFDIQIVTNSPDKERSKYFFLGYLNSNKFLINNTRLGQSFVIEYENYDIPYFEKTELPHRERLVLTNILSAERMPYKTFLIDKPYEEGKSLFAKLVEKNCAIYDYSYSYANPLDSFDQYVKSKIYNLDINELIQEMEQYNNLYYLIKYLECRRI